MRERAEVERLALRLDRQLTNDFSQNVRLVSLLTGHNDVRAALRLGRLSKAEKGALNQLVIKTARVAILVADASGEIVAAGLRNPDASRPIAALPAKLRRTLASNLLSRRFVQRNDLGWMFETARTVYSEDGTRLGYVLAYQSLEDLGPTWGALPENLEVSAAGGEVLYAHHRFDAARWRPLRISVPSQVHGTLLVLERDPRVLVVYGAIGLALGMALSLALIFGVSSASRRRALAEARINALADAAAVLEARVAERTAELRSEIEQHKRTEQALHDSQSQLVQASKLKVLNDMASGLSHELSQPLFALEANLDTLTCQLESQPQTALASLEKAKRVTRRMGQILSNLKGFARKDVEEPVWMDLSQPVTDALEILEHEVARGHVTVRHSPPAKPMCGMATPTRLQQVIVNIVSNSVDAVAKDGTGVLRITYSGDASKPQICICDNGPGFCDPKAVLAPFFTTKEDQNGLGLGLSISRDIMQSFGGGLHLGTATGGGASVTLDFNPGDGGHRP
ncbi:MAG: hypothetical protein KDJ69_07610 [Nitratireductor sp.]|nr:hypothetical protein [Nitratireductor sp.]